MRLHRGGPFHAHDTRSALTSREFIRAGCAAANHWIQKRFGTPLDGRAFFNALLELAMEGFQHQRRIGEFRLAQS